MFEISSVNLINQLTTINKKNKYKIRQIYLQRYLINFKIKEIYTTKLATWKILKIFQKLHYELIHHKAKIQ